MSFLFYYMEIFLSPGVTTVKNIYLKWIHSKYKNALKYYI